LTLFEEALRLLEAEFKQSGRKPLFEQLHPFLQGETDGLTYAMAARPLGTTEGTVKVTVNRMRQRYRELLRSALAQTLMNPLEVDEELEHLRAALRP
jgi:RNA polymerase sigma-70 factor (ECF subfamily)